MNHVLAEGADTPNEPTQSTDSVRLSEVLAAHRLSHTRPAMPGPGQVWTCTCGIFRISENAQQSHDLHLAEEIRPTCPCGCPRDMHIGEIGCPCALPGEGACRSEVAALREQVEAEVFSENAQAVLHGVTGTHPESYGGVTKDEALECAADLIERIRAALTTGATP